MSPNMLSYNCTTEHSETKIQHAGYFSIMQIMQAYVTTETLK